MSWSRTATSPRTISATSPSPTRCGCGARRTRNSSRARGSPKKPPPCSPQCKPRPSPPPTRPGKAAPPAGGAASRSRRAVARVVAYSGEGKPMKYDVVIVGGGAAGSVLAGRLAANAHSSVLLLEAGPDYPDPANLPNEIKFGHTRFAEAPDSQHNWALRGTITEEQGTIHVPQGKVIGGGSSINGQAMQRGFREDFDSWAALGNDEWSYDKILPYFRKSERDLDIQDDCHGSDGPMQVRRRQSGSWPTIQQAFHTACVQAGFGITNDTNGLHPAGLGVSPSNNIDGVRMSTAMTHLNPVRHHLNLTVRGGVFARKILIKDGKEIGRAS